MEEMNITREQYALDDIEKLLNLAVKCGLVDPEDGTYVRNRLLELFAFDAPEYGALDREGLLALTRSDAPELHDKLHVVTERLIDYACHAGLCDDDNTSRDLFQAKLMGLVTPSPAEVRARFAALLAEHGAQAATDWFYKMCCDCGYIRVERIEKNIRYFANTRCGELEITINLSKPEKDPREIAKLKNAPSVGYPRCMLCEENPGYAGRANFPARQNHRMVPLTLGGERWYLQYSPYKYYEEHCIVLSHEHRNMKIDHNTFVRQIEFVDMFPHYFIGSNADLPIVGGSILNHDHFQGGRYVMPMDRVDVEFTLNAPEGIDAAVLNWPMPTIQLISADKDRLVALADKVLTAWRGWSDESLGILAETNAPHNTITPIMHKIGDKYKLYLVLRNNRTDDENPLGIFHPHTPLHHIKRENIGLIEVMGLFILPGRLKDELRMCEELLAQPGGFKEPDEDSPVHKHYDWLVDIAARRGIGLSAETAHAVIQEELAAVCANVLADAGVYKQDEAGRAGLRRFLRSVDLV